MIGLTRTQSAVLLTPPDSVTIHRARSVPDLRPYIRYISKLPYRYYRGWDLHYDSYYGRYNYYTPFYRSTFLPRRYYYSNYGLIPYNYWYYPHSYWIGYRGHLYDYPSYYSRYSFYDDDFPRYYYRYSYPYRYSYHSPFDRYWFTSMYWDDGFKYRYY